MESLKIVIEIYKHLIKQKRNGVIPIDLRPASIIGTVQDDPFDSWIELNIKSVLPDNFEVAHSGSLTTPDIIIRDANTGDILSLEIKKLIQTPVGKDPRGLTMDFNSCLPCGSALIKVGKETVVIPCFYLFALLSNDSKSIVTLIIMDGDFLNYDFNLHKKAKFANISEYKHGPYGEGSVRQRKMYTYPNPLNYKLDFFHLRQIIIAKKQDFEKIKDVKYISHVVVRDDIYKNSFYYLIKDETIPAKKKSMFKDLPVLKNIFKECKAKRVRKEPPQCLF